MFIGVLFCFVVVWWDWGFNSELPTYKVGTALLEPALPVHFGLVVLEMESH
jgi:hypothetical protein